MNALRIAATGQSRRDRRRRYNGCNKRLMEAVLQPSLAVSSRTSEAAERRREGTVAGAALPAATDSSKAAQLRALRRGRVALPATNRMMPPARRPAPANGASGGDSAVSTLGAVAFGVGVGGGNVMAPMPGVFVPDGAPTLSAGGVAPADVEEAPPKAGPAFDIIVLVCGPAESSPTSPLPKSNARPSEAAMPPTQREAR